MQEKRTDPLTPHSPPLVPLFAGSSQRLACVFLQFGFNGVVETPLLTKSSPDRQLGARDDGLR